MSKVRKKRERSSPAAPVRTNLGAEISEHFLANGMRVLIGERRSDPVVAAMLFYRVGARNEREHEAGVSHFLEHMMFKGSAEFPKGAVDLITTALGGQNNAYTSWDHTAYWFQLASDRWRKALEIEADRMRTLLLDPDEFSAEREVVLEELAMGRDDPWRYLSESVQEALFQRHPYRRPVIGYADTLRRLSREEMLAYYRRFYHPGNATLVICGDVASDEALAAAREYFETIPSGPRHEEVDPPRAPLDVPGGEVRLTLRWDDPGRRLCMAWPTVAVGTDDDYALDLITTILSGGRLSRLHRRIVLERGLAVSASTSNDTRVEGGLFWLFAECAGDVDPRVLEAAVEEELTRLRDEFVSARELETAKAMLEASDAYDHETVSDLAENLGEYAVDADWRLMLQNVERTARVTAQDLRDVARRFLVPERRVVGWCLPKEEVGPRLNVGGRGKKKSAKPVRKSKKAKQAAKAKRAKATARKRRSTTARGPRERSR